MQSDLEKEFSIVASSFEDIDFSLHNFIDKTLNLHTKTNKGIEKDKTGEEGGAKNKNLRVSSVLDDQSQPFFGTGTVRIVCDRNSFCIVTNCR